MTATPVTVVAHYEDSLGVPQANQLIVFTPSDDLIINGTNGVPAQPVVARLDSNGDLSIQLWASNDPSVQPQGFTYQVQEFPNNPWGDSYSILVVASGSPVQLKSLAPVATAASTTYNYASTADVTAAIDALATVASSGLYTDLVGAPTVPTTAAQVGALSQSVADARYDPIGAAAAAQAAATTALALKANTADVTTSLAAKADSTDLTTGLAAKANSSDVNTALALKANATDLTTGLAGKANSSDLTSGLALKAPIASPAFTGTLTVNGAPITTSPATSTTPGTVQLPTGQTSTTLAKAAITGAYTDLAGLPTIPADPTAALAARLMISTALLIAAATPDAMANGAITRDANLTPTGYNVLWPDGATGVYGGTASTNSAAVGYCDSWVITHVPSGASTPDHTYSQPTMTRDATSGAVTNRPAITVS